MRRIVEDELRRLGVRLRDLDRPLELGLQESVRSAVLAGYGVTFISRAPSSPISRPARSPKRASTGWTPGGRSRSCGAPRRTQSRVADGFVDFARERIATLGGLGLVPAAAGE